MVSQKPFPLGRVAGKSVIRAQYMVKVGLLLDTVSDHSHILKVKYDSQLGLLHINPGAASIFGFYQVRTLVRFTIDAGVFKELEVIELKN